MPGRDQLQLFTKNDILRRLEGGQELTSTSAVVSAIQRLIDIMGVIPLPAPMNSIFDVG